MKTVLIVEDEKLIRQGIKAMIQRSGVPVDIIMECSNGEMALEVIKEQKIDVMFTDIRMPKMDGIELVKQMQSCGHVPLTVAISGYDDFSYAVEMLRSGVKEYILKPVEREKIVQILTKLNDEIESRKEQKKTDRKLGHQQMKHLILLAHITEEEIHMLEKQYEKEFYEGTYAVCCQNTKMRNYVSEENGIYLKDIEGNDIFVVEEEALKVLQKHELKDGYVGISGMHSGLRELRKAYLEAVQMRKTAYCRNRKEPVCYHEPAERIPDKLMEEASKKLTLAAKLQRVQLLGTDRTKELEQAFHSLFYEVKNGRITEIQYEECMCEFFNDAEKTYRTVFEGNDAKNQDYRQIWNEDCIDVYEEKLIGWLLKQQEAINSQSDVNKNEWKIKQAVSYLEENYAKDLNMAVVSNNISMNYTLFSYSFKQYTGSNFVNFLKDIRMREAKKLLAETDRKIIEISQEVGYDNEKHFMKLFKAACGVSPSEYRKNMCRD